MNTSTTNDVERGDSATSRSDQAEKLFQTGKTLVEQKKYIDKAIKCIQRAITLNDVDYKYWQYLGEAYFQRGSLNPAINCFIKSLKLAENGENPIADLELLESDRTHSRLRMSDIRLSVGHLDEAASGYSDIITKYPDHFDALMGLSRTELQMSKDSFSFGLIKSGRSHCMRALCLVLRAIKSSPHVGGAWKLASDCCLTQFNLGQRGSFEYKIDEDFPGSQDGSLVINREVCIELAQRFLCKSLDIEDNDKLYLLWQNIGVCLYHRGRLTVDTKERVKLFKRSIKCLLKALKLDRNNSLIKNSIGLVCYELDLLKTSQSFIIKSIQSSFTSAEAQFSNLGFIYLDRGEFTKAKAAFTRCQAEDPMYSRSWLGSAIVNENLNIDDLSLLRHCQRLGNNYESQLKFASKIVELPQSESQEKDIIAASDCMKRIINYDEKLLCAINTMGLIHERCSFSHQAKQCFDIAYNISPLSPKTTFNKLRQHDSSNSGCALGEIPIGLDSDFILKAEQFTNSGNREHMLNFINYLFRNEDYRSVDSKVTKLLDKLPQNDVTSKACAQITLGLAANKENIEFKSWFFKNIIDLENITCVESVINLTCLMIIGAASRDQQLVDHISGDLARHLLLYSTKRNDIDRMVSFDKLFYSNEGFWLRYALFSSTFCLKVSDNHTA